MSRVGMSAQSQRAWVELGSPGISERVAEFVQGGGVVVFPTESSYALGAEPTNGVGVAAIFRMKGRSADKPLPVVVPDREALVSLGISPSGPGFGGLEAAWPGPLTLVVPCERPLPASAGRSELAVRVIGHEGMRALLAETGLALTATSANLAGDEPIVNPAELNDLGAGENLLILDGGVLPGGPPSTLARCVGGELTILREGAVAAAKLRELASGADSARRFSAARVEIPVEEES